ncbi:5'-3' exonuclease H3TH domain-containing protein [Nocardioides sp.]|uniref:5'-3' exonuclease n=1 Tax=Nocardioides sp. TaxID=35761 RepID=UPI00262CEF43|nr:5'-3' exonuclease H3TH domain-containing protein [Nocardioides sp.]
MSELDSPRRTLLAVDGNSLTHRAYHAYAETGFRDGRGRPAWAVRGFWNLLLGTIDRIGPDAIVVGFDDPASSRRRARFPEYKAHRKAKDAALIAQLEVIPQTLAAAGITAFTPAGLEADDVMAAAARHVAATEDWQCVIATSDRDAFAQIGPVTSVLRIINGGIDNSPVLNPSRFTIMTGIRPEQYLDYAAMRGDASDNLRGIRGIGEKTAAALLQHFTTMEAVWADVDGNDGAGVVEATGKGTLTKLRADGARQAWIDNRLIMTPSTSLQIPSADPSRPLGELPLSADRVRQALEEASLHALVPSATNRLSGMPLPR